MLSSIHPLGERARNNRWWLTVTSFALGSTLSGGLMGLTLGAAGSQIDLPSWPALGFAVLAGVADLVGIRAPGPKRQVNERWIGTYRGWIYGAGFGIQLGLGVTTFVVTWGVYAVFLFELAAGPLAGSMIGMTFGLGRSVALILVGRVDRPSRLESFHRRMAALARPVHLGAGLSLVLLGASGLV